LGTFSTMINYFEILSLKGFNYFRISTFRGSNLVDIGKGNYEPLVKSLPLRISTNLFLGAKFSYFAKNNILCTMYWSNNFLKCSIMFSDLYIFTTCWNFQSFLIIRQRDVIFFLNFQTYQENILKIFNSFWNTMADPTNKLLVPPSQGSVEKRAFPWHTKGFETHNLLNDTLGFQTGLYH